jgi:hypothetical protein
VGLACKPSDVTRLDMASCTAQRDAKPEASMPTTIHIVKELQADQDEPQL